MQDWFEIRSTTSTWIVQHEVQLISPWVSYPHSVISYILIFKSSHYNFLSSNTNRQPPSSEIHTLPFSNQCRLCIIMQPPQYLSQDSDILLPTGTTNKNVIMLTCTFFYPLQNHIHLSLENFRCWFNPIWYFSVGIKSLACVNCQVLMTSFMNT